MLDALNKMVQDADSCKVINLNSTNIIEISLGSTSKGNQPKYYNTETEEYIKEQFCYQGILWKDYMVEHLSSVIYKDMNTDIKIINQEIYLLSNERYACVSKNFCTDSQKWIPMYKFECYQECKTMLGKSYKVFSILIEYFLNLGLDITEYLIVMIVMDFLLGNEDRHYGNFGVIKNSNGYYSISPLFDFGLGLFEHDTKYRNWDLDSAISLMHGKPFDIDLIKPLEMLFNTGKGKIIKDIFQYIKIPDKQLFPNELGYKYFNESFDYLMERINKI